MSNEIARIGRTDDTSTPAVDAVGSPSEDEVDAQALPSGDPRLEEAIGAELAASIQRLTGAEARLRDGGDAEDVHQMRVATRRLRSTLRVFRPALDGPWCDRLRKRLSALADVLGDARDADVMLHRLDERLSLLGEVDARAARPLREKLAQQADSARKHLLEHVDSSAHKRLRSTLAAAAARPRFAAEFPSEPPIFAASAAWEKLAAAIDALPDDPSAEELHRVRLLTKRARYTAETLRTIAGDGAERFAKRAADLQDVLGRIQDARVARSWLRSVGVRATPRTAYVAGLLAGLEGTEEDAARNQWRRAWKRLERKKVVAWMDSST